MRFGFRQMNNLLRDIEELLPRPVGRPSHKPIVWYKGGAGAESHTVAGVIRCERPCILTRTEVGERMAAVLGVKKEIPVKVAKR